MTTAALAAPEAAAPRPRAAVAALPAYRPGRSAADAMADHGIAHAVKLASNERPEPPTAAVVAAATAQVAVAHRYPDARATVLREALADHHRTTPDHVTVGCGASGLLQQLALAYVEPGDEVVRGEPSFEAYPIYTRLAGGRDVAVPARGATLDTVAMAGAVGPRTRLVVVAEPNNPTGTTVGAAALVALADAVPADVLLVIDAAYQEFTGGPDVASELALERANVVAVRTFSKAHALAGLRVGWAVGHPDVVAALDAVALPFAVSAPAQAAAVASLADPASVQASVDRVIAARTGMERRLQALGWDLAPSDANFVWLPAGAATDDLAVFLERHGVVARAFPGVGVRLSVGEPAANALALEVLAGWDGAR